MTIERLAYKPKEAAEVLGISISQVYALIKEERIKAIHLSSRLTLISADSIQEMLRAA